MNLRLLFLLLIPAVASGTQFYVSPGGNDGNPGTFDLPFLTIGKAVGLSSTLFRPGDTVVVRGGTYPMTVRLNLSKNGNAGARYYLLAYPGERALLDCSLMILGTRGVQLSGSYWTVRGIDVKGAGDNGMHISGSNNLVEFCTFFENRDTGLQISNGAANNLILNCDSYFNADPGGGNADGFAPKLDVGTGNAFRGCRAWQNSDDGWDGYLRPATDVTTTYDSCWCFANGYLKDGSVSAGNGNGFKMGGSDNKDLMHNAILRNCLAFDNLVKGFDQNNNRGSMTLINCTGYRNGSLSYAIGDTVAVANGKIVTVINCVALGEFGSLNAATLQQTNSWLPPFAAVTAADFRSIDTTGIRGPRKPDGSLPDIQFLALAPGSQLIDAGTDCGLPYNGPKPDLGAFETRTADGVSSDPSVVPAAFRLVNYPNPFNPATTIEFSIPRSQPTYLKVFDLVGREVATLLSGPLGAGTHRVAFNGAGLPSGVYICRLQAGPSMLSTRVLLIK